MALQDYNMPFQDYIITTSNTNMELLTMIYQILGILEDEGFIERTTHTRPTTSKRTQRNTRRSRRARRQRKKRQRQRGNIRFIRDY